MADTIHFSYFTASYDIYLANLHELPVSNIRKLVKWMLSEPDDDEDAIRTMDAYIPEHVAELKAKADAANIAYKQFFHKVLNPKRRPLTEAQKLQTKINGELTAERNSTKRQYDAWVKIQSIWDDTKHQMNLQ